ncbi:sodium:proton antiporter [Streptomyces lonarensis]|uniref:Cation:proton antiporter subunit C n=1 Tax=Streptomyces lonarensis TaxID=700599 RepID=A0A7X6HXK3_9ACTN|nr:cation:proton antiporter subunit C [Streptomyces lonarensis]NJQ04633.1 cation:proton antiporter subunit C [Streptomyces lonarensis]
MMLALSVGALVAGAAYLMLDRTFLRVIIGFVLFGHAVNLLLFSSGGILRRTEPLGSGPDPAVTADALPQAFVLTAIVIAFAITVYMLVLAVTGRADEDAPAAGSDEDAAPDAADEDAPSGTDDRAGMDDRAGTDDRSGAARRTTDEESRA